MGNSWVGRIIVDHSGSKWRRGSARITDHKFQARQGAANRDGSWEMGGGWYGPIVGSPLVWVVSYPYSIEVGAQSYPYSGRGGRGVDGVSFQSTCPPSPLLVMDIVIG